MITFEEIFAMLGSLVMRLGLAGSAGCSFVTAFFVVVAAMY
jgi:hypothetical protein